MGIVSAFRRLRQEDSEFGGQPGLYSETMSQEEKK
jgi:hypothetical protein